MGIITTYKYEKLKHKLGIITTYKFNKKLGIITTLKIIIYFPKQYHKLKLGIGVVPCRRLEEDFLNLENLANRKGLERENRENFVF